MQVIPIKKKPNLDAIEMLEDVISRIKSGEIAAVSVSWVTKDNAISGDVSNGENNLMMWASMEHSARSFYDDVINSDEG